MACRVELLTNPVRKADSGPRRSALYSLFLVRRKPDVKTRFPPFAGGLDRSSSFLDHAAIVRTKKTPSSRLFPIDGSIYCAYNIYRGQEINIPTKKPGTGCNRFRAVNPGYSPEYTNHIRILPRISRRSKGWFHGKRTPQRKADCGTPPSRRGQYPPLYCSADGRASHNDYEAIGPVWRGLPTPDEP